MDNSFFNYLLCLSLVLVLILYLYQNMILNKKQNIKINHINLKNTETQHLQNLQNLQNLHQKQTNIWTTCKTGMPVHTVGPAINFHQRFTKYSNNPTYTTVKGCGIPTGIRELGWRNFFLFNYSKNEIPEEDPFSGIITRNYLNNMENVDNIYRKCE